MADGGWLYSRVGAVRVEALAVHARVGQALDDVLAAGGPPEAGRARALVRRLQGRAVSAVLARGAGAVVLPLAVPTCINWVGRFKIKIHYNQNIIPSRSSSE